MNEWKLNQRNCFSHHFTLTVAVSACWTISEWCARNLNFHCLWISSQLRSNPLFIDSFLHNWLNLFCIPLALSLIPEETCRKTSPKLLLINRLEDFDLDLWAVGFLMELWTLLHERHGVWITIRSQEASEEHIRSDANLGNEKQKSYKLIRVNIVKNDVVAPMTSSQL